MEKMTIGVAAFPTLFPLPSLFSPVHFTVFIALSIPLFQRLFSDDEQGRR